MKPVTLHAERLEGAVGAAHVRLTDEQLVVSPGSASELGDVLRHAAESGLPVAVGPGAVLSLDLGRMRNVLHLDETSLLVSVQAGLTAEALEALLAERGLTLGGLPPASRQRTVGALLAAPRPSEATPRSGPFHRLCAGLQGLLADGTEVVTRVAPRKATGPDLMFALLGTRGTIGLITAASLRVRRRGEARQTTAFALPRLPDALVLARGLVTSGMRPADLCVTCSDPPVVWVALEGAAAPTAAARLEVERRAVAAGGRPVPATALPLATGPAYERALGLEQLDLIASGNARLCGWHTAGVALCDPDRAPAALLEPPPLLGELKRRLDPDRRFPSWPAVEEPIADA